MVTNTNANTNTITNTKCEAEEKEGHCWFQIAVSLLEQTHLQSAPMSVLHLWQNLQISKNKNKDKYDDKEKSKHKSAVCIDVWHLWESVPGPP